MQDPGHSPRQLKIYRASAGSGKTHLLTGFYLSLLFLPEMQTDDSNGPITFDQILAVTFTNKATAEMKDRIIDELHQLSIDPTASDYWDILSRQGQRSADEVRQMAWTFLNDILNDYSVFNVSTIDKFFQRIIRSFTRELNLGNNYDLELDSHRIGDATIDDLLSRLNKHEDKELYGWLIDYSKRLINEDSRWDLRKELKSLASTTLENSNYSQYREEILRFTANPDRVKTYTKRLDDIVKSWLEIRQLNAKKCLKEIENAGLELDDFTGKAKSLSFLTNCIESPRTATLSEKSKIITWAQEDSGWFPKTSKKHLSETEMTAIQSCFCDIVAHETGDAFRDYQTALVIRQKFFQICLLAFIDHATHAYCAEQNVMPMSSSTELLNSLIGDGDAPFIYEKIGGDLKSFMIDEFQDTAGTQWENFAPLLSNSLSCGWPNLIVGDVKQSIYRWRGGDWNLLDSGLNRYEPGHHYDDSTTLSQNWRSEKAIVDFNNRLFTDLARWLDTEIESTEISRIYGDVAQHFPQKKQRPDRIPGMVSIRTLVPTDEDGAPIASPRTEDNLNEAMRRLPETIIELEEAGYEPREIAILCRKGDQCQAAAATLLQYRQEHPDSPYGMDIISGEALLISSRPLIQTMIALIRHIHEPDNPEYKAAAWCQYFVLQGEEPEAALTHYFTSPDAQKAFHPELAHRPLYELCEELIALMPEQAVSIDRPFLQRFRDEVLNYANHHGVDLNAFLEWWSQYGCKIAIATPDTQNAINIMTIHKSKGLGIAAVIIPMANFEMDIKARSNDTLWCDTDNERFAITDEEGNIMPLHFPVDVSSSLKNTHFKAHYQRERLCAVIDNINTAYVALTRAKETMIIMAPRPKTDKEKLFNTYLLQFANNMAQANSDEMPVTVTNDGQDFTFGRLARDPRSMQKAQATVPCETPPLYVPTGAQHPVRRNVTDSARRLLQLPNLAARPCDDDDRRARDYGRTIHRALESLSDNRNIDHIVNHLFNNGTLDARFIAREELCEMLHRMLNQEPVCQWFRPGVQSANEMTLIGPDGKEHRPDRVVIEGDTAIVIDYKTLNDHAGYRKQVQEYMSLLRQMGFKTVRGYLWFLKDNHVEEVKEG